MPAEHPPGDHHAHHHSRPHLARRSDSPPGEDWLEVFYDVVAGIAIIELSDFLAAGAGPDLPRYLVFAGLLVPIWWVWMGWTVYSLRFEADDAPHRFLTFIQMLAGAAMVVQVHDAHTGSAIFAGAFVVARLSLLALYLRARTRVPASAPITTVYFRGFGLGASVWAVSIFVPPPGRYWLWGLGLAIDFFTPWLARATLKRLPLDPTRLLNRLGAFASIVLGVAVAGVITGVAEMHWNARAVLAAVLGFTIAACIWWARAEFIGRTDASGWISSGQRVIYINLPIVLGLATLSVGVQLAIVRAATGQTDPATFWLLGGGTALWVAGNAVLNLFVVAERSRRLAAAYLILLLVALAQPALGPRLPAPGALALLTGAFVALVLAETRPHTTPPRAEPAPRP